MNSEAAAAAVPVVGQTKRAKGEMSRTYRIATICGATPLLVGVVIFLLWLVTRWDWLMAAGMFTIYGGVAMLLFGAIALVRFCWLALGTPDFPRRRLWVSAVWCAALLLSNFPVAAAIVVGAVSIETRYVVTVHNSSSRPLTDVRVSGGGCEVDFGTVAPGVTVRRSFWVRCDGTLVFHAASGFTRYNETIDGYVTNGMGGNASVTVGPEGTISVADKKN
jgi:hypothetical protein